MVVVWMVMALIAAGTLLFAIYGVPQVIRWFQVKRWNRRPDCLALTYDDGPDSETTPELLDLLEEKEVRATFYLVGFRSEKCPSEIERLRVSGHELGVHSHAHLHAWKVWPWTEYRDAHRGYISLAPAVESTSPFRPPFGKITLPTLLSMWRKGRQVQWWSVATNDTDERLRNAEDLAERILDSGKKVILMHCHHHEPERRKFVLDMTRALIEEARARGLAFVTMSEFTSTASVLAGDPP